MWYQLEKGRLGAQGKWMYYIDGARWSLVCYDSGPRDWCVPVCLDGADPIVLDATVTGMRDILDSYYGACVEWGIHKHKRGRISTSARLMRDHLAGWLAFCPG